MEKIDFKKEYSTLYKASAKEIQFVDVPKLNYIMVDGYGNPNNSVMFNNAVEALYSVSYTLKFMIKKGEQHIDYGVMPLEGLWWTDNMKEFSMENKSEWKWTLMVLQPDFITHDLFEKAKEQAGKKKELPLLKELRLETMEEGPCAQILYVGPYDDEPPTIARLHDFIKENGYKLHGKHREIYLNDARRTAPERLKTIIRQPVRK